jgi:hypothetical protein
MLRRRPAAALEMERMVAEKIVAAGTYTSRP